MTQQYSPGSTAALVQEAIHGLFYDLLSGEEFLMQLVLAKLAKDNITDSEEIRDLIKRVTEELLQIY